MRGGTYVVMEGPQFSTKAESVLYRSWGCQVIGMTNMPEAKLAREAEMCYATVAMVTDYDCWHEDHDHVTVDQVVRVLLENADKARALVRDVVPRLVGRGASCHQGCHTALDNALITQPQARDPRVMERLDAVAGRGPGRLSGGPAMESLWSDDAAARAVRHYGAQGASEDLALRVYTTRILGGEPRLVLHGGGNTSVKTRGQEVTGEPVEVLCVKGSGWDMAAIEPPGLPAVRLQPLRRLAALDRLSDEEMVNVQRCNLLDSRAPNPSVETLLHAFLPHKFVDHTHANAALALTDQPDGAEICREVFGDKAALVPYIMPGFALAKKAAEVYRENPGLSGPDPPEARGLQLRGDRARGL